MHIPHVKPPIAPPIAAVRAHEFPVAVQFVNFRD